MVELLDNCLHGFKVKYMVLDQLLADVIGPKVPKKKKLDTVNIFINMESLYNSFRNKGTEKTILKYTKEELRYVYRQLIAGIINVAAHYRKYFAYNKVKTNIVYYYNEIKDVLTKYNNSFYLDDYREHFFESLHALDRWTVNGMVKDIIPLVKIICKYLENIYVIGADRVEASLIPFFIDMEGLMPSNMNIFVTKDEYDFQYVNYRGLIVVKYQDTPILLSKKNLMRYIKWKHEINTDKMISPLLMNFILSCVGDRKRSIRGLKGVGYISIYKELAKLYDVGYILPQDDATTHVRYLVEILGDQSFKMIKKQDLIDKIVRNYKTIAVDFQYEHMEEVQKMKIKEQIIDKNDPKALMEINEKYFEDTPIQLFELNQFEKETEEDKEIRKAVYGW